MDAPPSTSSKSQQKRKLTSTASYQPIPQAELDRLVEDTFDKTSSYIRGQISGTLEDLKLVEDMNNVVTNKYTYMTGLSGDMCNGLVDVNGRYSDIHPYLAQIDEIESGIKNLEIAACTLDAFVRNLGTYPNNLVFKESVTSKHEEKIEKILIREQIQAVACRKTLLINVSP